MASKELRLSGIVEESIVDGYLTIEKKEAS